jgi:hypothetical protein
MEPERYRKKETAEKETAERKRTRKKEKFFMQA